MKPVHLLHRSRGLTLVELMISLVIGMVVVGAVIVSYLGSGRAGRYQSALSQMNQDAQIGLNILSRDVQLAGYSQPVSMVDVSGGAATPQLMMTYNDLVVNTTATVTVTASIRGCDGTQGTPVFVDPTADGMPSCAASSTPTVSGIAVVYEADLINTVPSGNSPTDCLGNAIAPAVAGTPTYYVARNRYYVRTGPSGRPELYCATNKAGGSPQPLLENVEDMQIWYGVSNVANPRQVVRYVKAGKDATTPNTVNATAAGTPDEWNRVLAVRICLLMRSAEPVFTDSEDTATYLDCNSQSQTSTDRRLRRAYFTTATVRSKMAF